MFTRERQPRGWLPKPWRWRRYAALSAYARFAPSCTLDVPVEPRPNHCEHSLRASPTLLSDEATHGSSPLLRHRFNFILFCFRSSSKVVDHRGLLHRLARSICALSKDNIISSFTLPQLKNPKRSSIGLSPTHPGSVCDHLLLL